jgi:hypothetical protein
VVTIEALPSVGSDAFGQYGGAYVHVYTSQCSKEAALASAHQALADGIVLVFHTYPLELDDDDVIH